MVSLVTMRGWLPGSLSCEGCHQTWQGPLRAFFLTLYYLASYASKTIAEGPSSSCIFFAMSSSFKWRHPWTCFGGAKPPEGVIAFSSVRPLCRMAFLNLSFIIVLSSFRLFSSNCSSLLRNVNATDILDICWCTVAVGGPRMIVIPQIFSSPQEPVLIPLGAMLTWLGMHVLGL